MERRCRYCEKSIEGRDGNALYCLEKCGRKYRDLLKIEEVSDL